MQLLQENSYFAFGKVMSGGPITMPGNPNRTLYNGGAEWQSYYDNLPDYYQTFYRNYDPNLGRFIGVDPMAEAADDLTVYNYSGNNPVMFNDPMGDLRNTMGEQYWWSPVPPRGNSSTNPEEWALWDLQLSWMFTVMSTLQARPAGSNMSNISRYLTTR